MSETPEEKWFEVVTYFKPEEGQEMVHEGQRIFICGDVGEVTVAQVAEVYGNDGATVARIKAAHEAMQMMGVDKGLVVTNSVQFMKLREVVDREMLTKLNHSKKAALH